MRVLNRVLPRLARIRRALSGRLFPIRELRSLRDVALFAQLMLFAACVPLLMRLPVQRVASVIVRPPRRRRDVSPDRIARLVSLAPVVGRPLVKTGCLTRGVTLFWFLRDAGVDVELRFGVDPFSPDPDGHCWLTLDGEPYLEKVDPREHFAEVFRLPLQPR